MDWSKDPLLFTPSQAPVRLDPARVIVLGRSQSCDLSIPSPEASRKHAELRFHDDAWHLHDLGSTNGTRVNGAGVEGQRRLAPGDRIEIGGHTVTFCQMESRGALGENMDEAKTRLHQPRPEADALRGDLAEIPSFAVLQVLEMGRKTGVLDVTAEGAEGRIWFEAGAPVHAEAKGCVGFDAAVVVCHAVQGRFVFESGVPAPENTIRCSVTQLLLEATRQLDEGARLEEIPEA
jgi:pSer/pThr/pTyr-binding forkhead associated (FHA) protein